MKLKLHWQIFIGIIFGVLLGVVIHVTGAGWPLTLSKLVGDVFVSLLRMAVVPLILASMVSGVLSTGDIRKLGKMGLKTLVYYLATTGLAVLVGIIMVNLIRPGIGVEKMAEALPEEVVQAAPPGPSELILRLIPTNPFKAMAETDVLGIIFFALLLGFALVAVGERAQPLARFFEALTAVMMRITHWIMRISPFGVAGLMAEMVGKLGLEPFIPLLKYMGTVMIGLAFHFLVTLPLLLLIFGRLNPFWLMKQGLSALFTAYSTDSSAATLPVTMACTEENAGIPRRVTSFVLPLGATINMDGTALYEAVAVIFIAQAWGVALEPVQQIMIFITATLAAIGAAPIPSAGLFTMIIVLEAVGLPTKGIGLILAVDRILDMFRTTTNVWGDMVGSAIIARTEGAKFSNE